MSGRGGREKRHFVKDPHTIVVHAVLAHRGENAGGLEAVHHLDFVCAAGGSIRKPSREKTDREKGRGTHQSTRSHHRSCHKGCRAPSRCEGAARAVGTEKKEREKEEERREKKKRATARTSAW